WIRIACIEFNRDSNATDDREEESQQPRCLSSVAIRSWKERNHDRFLFAMSRATVVTYAPAATVLVVGVALQCVTIANHDVAWLLTLAERLLSGAHPDIDFIE